MDVKELLASVKREGKLPDNFEKLQLQFTQENLLKSGTLEQAFGLNKAEMEELYEKAYDYYMANKYEEAKELFRLLVLFNPFVQKYWMGFGASQMLNHEEENALKAFAMAAYLNPKDPYPHFHAYECYLALSNEEEMRKGLEEAYSLSKNETHFSTLRQEIEEIMRIKWPAA